MLRRLSLIALWCVALFSCDNAPGPEPSQARFDPLPAVLGPDLADYQMWTRWTSPILSWKLVSASQDSLKDRAAVQTAFSLWQRASSLRFRESPVASEANILVGYAEEAHCELYAVSGRPCPNETFEDDVLGHTYHRRPGHWQAEIHLRVDLPVELDAATDSVYRLAAAMHQVGHALGLGHLGGSTSVMGHSADSEHPRSTLSNRDVSALQALYGPRGGAPPTWTAPVAVPEAWQSWCSLSPPSTKEDSDGDGVDDQVERYVLGTDPAMCDTDTDELSDEEALIGLMARLSDTDGDTNVDGLEVGTNRSPFIPNFYYWGCCPMRYGSYEGAVDLGMQLRLTIGNAHSLGVVGVLSSGEMDLDWNGQPFTVPLRGGLVERDQLVWTSPDHFYELTGIPDGDRLVGTLFVGGKREGSWSAR